MCVLFANETRRQMSFAWLYYKSHSVDLAVAMDIKCLPCSDLVVGLLSWRVAIVVLFALQMRDPLSQNHVSDGYN